MIRAMANHLLDDTLALARATTIPVSRICRDTGLGTRWYHMLLAGEIRDPGVRRVQRLHDYLAKATTDNQTPEAAPSSPGAGEPAPGELRKAS